MWGVKCLFSDVGLSVHSGFAIILMEKKRVTGCYTLNVFLLSCGCLSSLPGWSVICNVEFFGYICCYLASYKQQNKSCYEI